MGTTFGIDYKVTAQEVKAEKKRAELNIIVRKADRLSWTACRAPKEESGKQSLESRGLHEVMKRGVAIVVREICRASVEIMNATPLRFNM
jgi:hypothetical protein